MGRGRGISSSGGGIMGSGVFGLFGSIVNCKAEDDGMYCSIVKMFNLMMMFLIVCFVLYFVYSILTTWLSRPSGRRSR
jgi:hypothetical protein|uniref:Uncharacterized protein n=1 Tax=viral metagenome TaxID=1070528 RepID=A0A6C0DXD0_9ZZZZ